jgi:formylglycine-generating enzyme required for sulfatase activity
MNFKYLILTLSLWGTICANNMAVTNVALTGKNVANSYTLVEFDLSWENSWRTSSGAANWDAAWVFVKYRANGGEWQHASLNTTANNHNAPAGSTIDVPSDGKGVFLFRDSDGSGTLDLDDVQLRWEYGSDGVADNDLVEAKVFAIEMVYVAQGSFVLGSGRNEYSSFSDGSWTSGDAIPFTISSENSLSIHPSAGNLWFRENSDVNATIGNPGTLPAAYPKGYDAFYCMKYELTQSQYRDFLNTLTYTQQDVRTIASPNSAAGTGALDSLSNAYRQGITIMTSGVASSTPAVYACNLDGDGTYNEPNDGQSIACNWMSWADAAAFLDWAALRPMTEMEFEKACRGTTNNIRHEFAWGTGSRATGVYTLINEGTSSEAINTNYVVDGTTGNMSYSTTIGGSLGSIQGPLRVGIFAANGSSTGRVSSGASYWGIMELSGNLRERTVSVSDIGLGRSYTGINGDGSLSSSGHANQSNWPGMNGSGQVTTAQGSGHRGGAWPEPISRARVSDRQRGSRFTTIRWYNLGVRGVR